MIKILNDFLNVIYAIRIFILNTPVLLLLTYFTIKWIIKAHEQFKKEFK